MSVRLTGQPIGEAIHLVEVHGDLDLATAPDLKRRLGDAIDEGWRRVLVDLTSAAFIDSSGLAALVFGHRRLDASGGVIAVVAPSETQRRIFDMTGLVTLLGVKSTVAEAVAHLVAFR